MISFMVISAPRCGTTWAGNWLTTDATLCLHDPLFERHYQELDAYPTSKMLGVACTGMAYFWEWVDKHPARKVILHRDESEINASLAAIGLPPVEKFLLKNLDRIQGMHVDWRNLFDSPRTIYEYLTQLPFDYERHELLKNIEMQPQFSGLKVGREVTRRLATEMRAAMEA